MLLEELVPQALRYLRLDPLAPERTEFDHVLVDEYQDLNQADMAVVHLLADEGSLTIVGDDDQSIYGFRFAHPSGIREFTADEEVQFVECRRCPRGVLRLANALVGRDPDRSKPDLVAVDEAEEGEIHHVRFATAEDEARGIAEFISHRIESGQEAAGDCLVLVNSRVHAQRIREALEDSGVAAETFFREEAYDSTAPQEAITLLTLHLAPGDRVAERAWLGIGHHQGRTPTYLRLWQAADAEGISLAEAFARMRAGQMRVRWSTEALARWGELVDRLSEFEGIGDDLRRLVDKLLPEGDSDLAGLRSAALLALDARSEGDPPSEFPNAVRYAVSQPDVPFDATFVRIMSLHRSKGLTTKVVLIAGLVDGMVPYPPPESVTMAEQRAHHEEQRRVLYVALTRSSDTLVLSNSAFLPFSEVRRYRVRHGVVRRTEGEEPQARTFPSPLLAELGETLPGAVSGDEWWKARRS